MKKHLLIPFFLISMFLGFNAFSQSFTPIETTFNGAAFSQASWADIDNDGDLDFIVFGMTDTGTNVTTLYENKGNDEFTELENTGIEGLSTGSCAWGDYDNDGDVDLLIQGANNDIMPFTTIYKNNGNGNFEDINPGLDQVYNGNERWVDIDNDGYLDIYSAGFNNTDYEAKIYKNNGDGTFSEVTSVTLPGVINSTAEWCDYDKDGDMDFIFMGVDFNSNFLTTLYKNNGDGTFEDAGVEFPQAWLGDAAWGDYNMDGYPDLIISGFVYPGRITNLYKNNGDGTFTLADDTTFQKVSHSALEWGDYDNDGDPDLFLAGVEENDDGSWSYYTYLYDNNGDGTFKKNAFDFTAIFWGDAEWGDYNNDGKLDLLQTGYNENFLTQTVVYRNDIETVNTPPTPPDGLTAQIDSSSVTLSWNMGSDNETPAEGLSYNIYLYKYDGDTICPPNSDYSNGYRLITALMGNVCQNTSWTINGLDDGTYLWSVQAIDNAHAGSAFAEKSSFTIDVTDVESPVCVSTNVYPNPVKDVLTVNLGDINIDEISLLNTAGQVVLNKKINAKTYNLDMSSITSGVYFLKINTGNEIITQKVVKE